MRDGRPEAHAVVHPGSIAFDRSRPQDARVELHAAATNTVRFDGSHLLVPVRRAKGRRR